MRTRPRQLLARSLRRDPMVAVGVLGVLVAAIVLATGLVRAEDARHVGIDVEVGDEAETTFVRTGPASPFGMPMRDVDRDRPLDRDPASPAPFAASASERPRSPGARRPVRRPSPGAGRPARQPAREPARPLPVAPAPTRPAPPAPPAPPAQVPEAVRPAPPGNPGPVGGGADPSPPVALPPTAAPNATGGAVGPVKDLLAPAVGDTRSLPG